MGLHHLLLLPLLLLLNQGEVTALDLEVSEPQLVAEGGDVELTCEVNFSSVNSSSLNSSSIYFLSLNCSSFNSSLMYFSSLNFSSFPPSYPSPPPQKNYQVGEVFDICEWTITATGEKCKV